MSQLYSTPFYPGFQHYGDPGFGPLGAEIPPNGTNGPSAFYGALQLPADADKEVMGRVTRKPGGTFDIDEYGGFQYQGGPDYFDFILALDGVDNTNDIGYGPGISRIFLNPGFVGEVTLGDVLPTGSFSTVGASGFNGAITLDDVAPAGIFSAAGASMFSGNITLEDVAEAGVFDGGSSVPDPLCQQRILLVPADIMTSLIVRAPTVGWVKDVDDVLDYGADFTQVMAQLPDDEIVAMEYATELDLTVLAVAIRGNVLAAMVTGGRPGRVAALTFRAVTNMGRKIDAALYIQTITR